MAFSDSHYEGDSELVLACRNKEKLSTVYKLLKEGADVNSVDRYGRTPLHYVTQHEGWLDLVKELIDSHSSDPLARDNHNTTPLHYACRSGRLEVARLLIETYKCDPQARDKELNTPLHLACQTGQVRVVALLLETCKCDPNCENMAGLTPLQITFLYRTGIISTLIHNGANPNVFDNHGNTPLHVACEAEGMTTIECLLESESSDPNCKNMAGLTPLQVTPISRSDVISKLIHSGANPNVVDNSGNTPLHVACKANLKELKTIGCLLESESCDPNIENGAGLTPLQVTPLSRTDIISKLVHNGANPNVVYPNGNTLLHKACKAGALEGVKYLFGTAKFDPNCMNKAGLTPLQVTPLSCPEIIEQLIRNGASLDVLNGNTLLCKILNQRSRTDCFPLIRELVQCGVNPNIVNTDGNTPLHLACKAEELKTIECLVESENCDPNIKNEAGLTPLQVTPISRTDVISMLINNGANPNVVDSDGNTLLHKACKTGALGSVQYLLERAKCDPNCMNKAGLTPLQVAPLSQTDVISKLIHNGANPNVVDSDGNTLLHHTCKHIQTTVTLSKIDCLLESENCNPNIKNKAGLTPLQVTPLSQTDVISKLIHSGANPNFVDLLHRACKNGALGSVQYLLERAKCDPNCMNKAGLTPLQVTPLSQTDVISKLIQNGANTNVVDSDGNTLLHKACIAGATEHHVCKYVPKVTLLTIDCLFESENCDPNIKNKADLTPLQVTPLYQSVVISKLIHNGANPNVVHSDGNTLLHRACKTEELETIECLLESESCDPNIKNNAGQTPLQVTPISCSDVISMLINNGANPHVIDSDGNTLLHKACIAGATETVKCLLGRMKCDPNYKNKTGLTPLDVLVMSSPDIIRELIRHGANPQHVYKTHGKVLRTTTPLQPPVKVFVVGNPSTGKSTLTASLKNESKVFGRIFKVSGVDEKTAGIDPHEFQSKKYGSVTLYDFAGQRSYYSSHAAVLRNTIQSSPPVFIIVVELLENEDEIAKNIMFWLSFLNHQQFSTENRSHVLIVGSHADKITRRGERAEEKMARVIESLPPMNDFHIAGSIPMDCRYPVSDGMTRLQKCLKESCSALRISVSISFNAHCFFIYLLDKFKASTAITVRDIQRIVTSDTSSSTKAFIPDSLWALCNICDELNDRGHILYLKDQRVIENSWVILNKAALLSEVTGTIFAPADFKQHCILASSTGVVPLSNISSHFPDHNIEMLIAFLYHLEYCREITDTEARSLIIEHHQLSSIDETEMEHSDAELYFLFPGLIRLDAPENVWEPRPQYSHYFGWKLQCQSGKFFTTRLLQVLILRLAFSFALAPEPEDLQSEVPAFQRRCSIWKSGIFWGDSCGVEALVEMVPTNDAVILLMRCRNSNLENLLQLRSNLIQKILGASIELCNRISAVELFADPSDCTQHPVKSMTTFGLKKVANAVIKEVPDPAVVSSTGSAFPLENLLIFDPYVGLGESILQDMFDAASDDIVSDVFLSQLAERLSCSRDVLVKLFKPNPTLLAERISKSLVAGPSQEVLFAIKMWRDGCNGTYSMLREKLDQFSIFAGRNPLILAGFNERQKKTNGTKPSESPTAVHLGDTGDELRSEPKLDKLLSNPPKGFKPTLQQLQVLEGCGGKRVRVMDSVAAEWEELAIALGFGPSDIDRLRRDYIRDAKGACRQVLTMWLNGESSHKNQPLTWATLIQCLIDAGFVDIAEDLNEVLGDDVGYNTSDQQQ